MLYQLINSIMRVRSNPKGTNVEYKNSYPNLNISLTICNNRIIWPVNVITNLSNIHSISQRENENGKWVEYQDINMSDIFVWHEKLNFNYICKTIDFVGAEVKIVHNFHFYANNVIFLHDPNFLTNGNSLKLFGSIFDNNNFLLLNVQQIQNIEEENVCSSSVDFDGCRNNYIIEEFNNTFGCIHSNMK